MRTKTFYIAARYQEAGRELRSKIIERGHLVKARWLDATDFGAGKPYGGLERRVAAVECWADAKVCDELVMIANAGERGGRHVEMGIALGLSKRCHVIGEPENVFHSHPYVTVYPTVEAFLEKL